MAEPEGVSIYVLQLHRVVRQNEKPQIGIETEDVAWDAPNGVVGQVQILQFGVHREGVCWDDVDRIGSQVEHPQLGQSVESAAVDSDDARAGESQRNAVLTTGALPG